MNDEGVNKPEIVNDSDLSKAAGGCKLKRSSIFDDIEYEEIETVCSQCGKKFTERRAKGLAFAGLPVCPHCKAGKPMLDITRLQGNNTEK